MPRLLLVRHATSVRPVPGGPDEHERPLSPLGVQQAEDLAAVLLAESPDRVISSPYLRSVQTVLPTARALGLQVETRDALREWNAGIDATPGWEPHYRQCWRSPAWVVPGGETHAALEQRAVAAMRKVAAQSPEASVVILGSHGTWIARALLGLGHPVDEDAWLGMPMPAVFEVEFKGQRLELRALGAGI